ncbi:ParB/RepB/Spo0J family partition protein [Oscillospiraceae bacterium NSJ-54]|uniref:ParB/RepB/Spo0J family partition protein n=2 Tax=Zongyangia hominis TaxID=2763677 RepID=A0A926E9Z4_9FIRM|nr:ParB/RepB/Spo0J family partition protein [Zongyangia hominis]
MIGRNKKESQNLRQIRNLPLEQIVPNPMQPRKYFSQEELTSLAASIRENGLLQPITVRAVDGRYELVAGERRLRASKLAGLPVIPAIVLTMDDNQSAVLSLVENIQREDLNFVEEALAIKRLIAQYGYTQEDVARLLGKNQSTVANKLRILKLPHPVLRYLCEHHLTERHARALLKLETEEQMRDVAESIVKYGWNVSQTEKYIDDLLTQQPKAAHSNILVVKDIRLFINTINKALSKMKASGIPATAVSIENGDFIEYTIKIPKVTQKRGKITA